MKILQGASISEFASIDRRVALLYNRRHRGSSSSAPYSSSLWNFSNNLRLRHSVSHRITSKIWLCRLTSSDNEFRSSRNIAISLFRRYRNLVDRGGGDNLKEFINGGVNAYELGCTEEGLRHELQNNITEIQEAYGGSLLSSNTVSQQVSHVEECIMWVSLVFITILCTPQPTIVRWSSTPPVSDSMLIRWKGFCAIIANAYFTRGMAWLPVKTLQLEQMVVMGDAEEPSLVASRMRLIFGTLEVSH